MHITARRRLPGMHGQGALTINAAFADGLYATVAAPDADVSGRRGGAKGGGAKGGGAKSGGPKSSGKSGAKGGGQSGAVGKSGGGRGGVGSGRGRGDHGVAKKRPSASALYSFAMSEQTERDAQGHVERAASYAGCLVDYSDPETYFNSAAAAATLAGLWS